MLTLDILGPTRHFGWLSRWPPLIKTKCIYNVISASYIDPFIGVSDIYAKISVYEIKIGPLNAPLIFHQQIMVMNDGQGELVTTLTQILVRMVI